ncbi:MAG TPA: RnfABCDGE type electron transport complex subunit D [Ktedonosporobacter sp.]|nr:RnfABCDGE type electron transport complex subunit D [Ktedonosporobacter sp.]
MIWKLRGITIVGPSLKDPRLFMIGVLTIYTILGQTILSFDHQWLQIFTSILVACVLDTALSYWKTRQIVLPVSGLITGMGLGLLVESIPLWPFVVAPALAIGAKAFIRFQGRNIFNPSNFGLTVLLVLTPATVTTLAAQWSGSTLIVMLVLVVGGFTAFRVSRWDLVLSFVGGFALMAFIEQLIAHNGLIFVYGPMLGAAFQLFTLSMLTDPKTTPDTRRMRIVFGLSLALVDGILRLMSIQNSPFIALFFISAWVPILRLLAFTLTTRRVSLKTQDVVGAIQHENEPEPVALAQQKESVH